MQEAMKLQIATTRKDAEAWFAGRELEELSVITNVMPEEHLYLKRRASLVEDEATGVARLSIDAEEVSFDEVDGQKVPTYGTVTGVVVVELREISPGQVEIRGFLRPMGKVTSQLEAYLERLGRQVQEAFTPPNPA
jgi:hypothetical protein